jgi:predicted Zn-dependent protease
VQDLALADELRNLQRRERRTRLILTLHIDSPSGRGSARVELATATDDADDVIDHAIALAEAAIGPAWFSAPPAAPADVAVVDRNLLQRELDAATRNTLAALRRPAGTTVAARLEIVREQLTVVASSGFRYSWPATRVRAHAVVTSAGTGPARRLAVTRQARRVDDLELDAALAAAAADLVLLADAGPPSAGPCALWLPPAALLHDDDLGLWSMFAHHADAAVERQGLARYRLHSEIAPGAAQLAEPLSIVSDGALDFAGRSSPVADDAVAVRRFAIIERGLAVGLGLSPREAALRSAEPTLRSADPNGGVRNLVVAPGSWLPAPSPRTRTIEARRLASVVIDPATGDASLDIALGLEHLPDHAPRAFTGGTIHLDLITALALAQRSTTPLRRGAYAGPASVLIDDAFLLA